MTKALLLFLMYLPFVFLYSQDTIKPVASKKAGVSFELALTGCFGGASNNSGNAELSNLSYPSLTFPEGHTDTILYSPSGGINAGFEMNLLFGKKRNLGFGVGIHYTVGFNSFRTDTFEMEYRAQDKNQRSFKRVLSLRDWKEKVTYSNLSLPVLFKYRAFFGKKEKAGLFAEIGPVIVLMSSAKSVQQAVVDFGAVYATEGELHYETENSSTDWVLTRRAIEKHFSEGTTNNNIATYFTQQYSNGYYVGIDKNSSGSSNIKYKIGFGGLLRAGFIYQIIPSFAITLGGQCTIVSSARKTNSTYQPVETGDDFERGIKLNSLLNSTGSLLTAQYGLHIGLLFKVVK